MAYEIRPLENTFAAEVVGLDLHETLDESTRAAIRAAFAAHHVLVFREQQLDKQAQLDFTLQFGDLDVHAAMNAGDDVPEVHTVSNLNAEGQPEPGKLGSTHWHSDKSYRQVPSTATFLHAIDVPEGGGDTWFADMASALDALPPERQQYLSSLRVVHSWERSVAKTQGSTISAKEREQWPAVAHPLTPRHPENGRKAIFIGQHASHIEGLPLREGETLIADLQTHCTQSRFIYKHQWRAGDLLMWDNRCLLHRAMDNFDTQSQRRVLHRTVTRGSAVPAI